MSVQTGTIKYARAATFGSVAYDLNRVRRGSSEYEIPAERQKERPKEQTREKTREKAHTVAKTKTVAKNAAGVSAFSVIGFSCIIALAILLLLAYVQLTEISADTVQVQNQLAELDDQEKQLLLVYEQTFNLNEIEDYAVNVCGMSLPSEDQIVDVSVGKGDKAVILEQDSSKESTPILSVVTFLSSLVEYFK